ncbi:MAG: fumarylacetoacetate hydrolase family protein [Actinomycetota bacterium]|nr:fumarylacetoacetate hydrolase family protein [Actinomycetota bacterium]
MKLVSYDKRGHRRLGALTGGRVVDLPDAVGHPVFPTTMEALVSSSRGTVLDAAREALERDGALEFAVRGPRLLVPLLPTSIRTVRPPTPARGKRDPMAWYGMPGYAERDPRRVTGPDEEVSGPGPGRATGFELWLACVAGSAGRGLSPEEAGARILGYTVMTGSVETDGWTSLGPCVVTADEIDPQSVVLTARVGADVPAQSAIQDVPWGFPELMAHLSWNRDVCPGDVLGAGGVRLARPVPSGSVVEVEAPGIGVLRNRIG